VEAQELMEPSVAHWERGLASHSPAVAAQTLQEGQVAAQTLQQGQAAGLPAISAVQARSA
jgi:hypothetical protein